MNLIEQIKKLFEATNNFLDAKLVDGTIVRVEGDSFKVGDLVNVITEAGETVQAPEGEHQLEDGTVLVINAEGRLTEVRPLEVTEEMPTEEMVEVVEPMETPVEEAIEEVVESDLADRVSALEEALVMLIEKLQYNSDEMKKTKETLSIVQAEKEVLEKTPAAKPLSIKKFEKTESVKINNSASRIEDLLANNIKK
jgi:hypothetical protein